LLEKHCKRKRKIDRLAGDIFHLVINYQVKVKFVFYRNKN